ncbi:MAG: ATP-binding protein [Eggerthellaceae bacterium]|nr:ATP-binding protein [Eggerthellaceae bacterium]
MPNMTSSNGEGGCFTREELDELGIEYPAPPTVACEYCGQILPVKAFEVLGNYIWVASEECGCPESKAAKAEEMREKKAHAEKERLRKYLAAGIEKRYLGAVVYETRSAAFISAESHESGRGMYITGGVGSGKTYLASAIARACVDMGWRVIMTKSTDMLASIQDTFENNSSSIETIRAYGTCKLLVIDDLGKESASDWSVATIFQIVNMRYGAMLPTIVTSQYPFSGLIERFSRRGDDETALAIVSRLKETCEFVDLGSRNRRLRK